MIVLAHAWNMATGVAVSLACALYVYLIGLGLIPRRWDGTLTRGVAPAFLGAAAYVIACWYGIAFGVPIRWTVPAIGGILLLLIAIRLRWFRQALSALDIPGTLVWLTAFGFLYVLTYLFTMPPVTREFLPPAWTGNIDLLTYARYTKYLLRLGPSNLPGFSYLADVYLQTPGVFYILGLMAIPVSLDPLRAAMPAAFAFTALSGLLVARISRSVFSISRAAAFAIACVFVSGPVFRYVAGAYFLSTLMSLPVVLYLVWTTVCARPTRIADGALALRFGSGYILLLLLYPFLLLAALAAQAGVIVLRWVADRQTADQVQTESGSAALLRTACNALAPLAAIAIVLFQRSEWSLRMIVSLSRAGIAGWPLDIILPTALFGLPAVRADFGQCMECIGIEAWNPAVRAASMAILTAIAVTVVYLYFGRYRNRTTPAERALVGLSGLSLIAYCAYFLQQGPSYQQWKFASYSALPLSFVVLAAITALAQRSRNGRGSATLTILAAAAVAGNLLTHAFYDPPMVRLPGELRNLAAVDQMSGFKEITMQMTDEPSGYPTWLALYFLPSKVVHVISERFRPSERLSFETVSPQRPLLVQNYGCEGVGHEEAAMIPGIGCLLTAPPSPAVGTLYPFNRSFLFLDSTGLSTRKPWGRVNLGPTVTLDLMADARRIPLHGGMYVNLLLQPTGPLFAEDPYLPVNSVEERLVVTWGSERAETNLTGRAWISLPVGSEDWSGNWVWTLPITVSLQSDDRMPDPQRDAVGAKRRHPALVFEGLSVTKEPAGSRLIPSH